MSETLDINKNIWLWLYGVKPSSIESFDNINKEFPEFNNLPETLKNDLIEFYAKLNIKNLSSFLQKWLSNSFSTSLVDGSVSITFGLGILISILNLNPRFIELTKDDHNTYINNVSNIMVNKDLNLRPHLNALIKLLKDNESEVLSYVDNQGLADEYNSSTSDYEKLGFLFCALLKELRTIALEENLINY